MLQPDEATLKRLIRKGTLKMDYFPMLCGSAFKNKGVQPMLDAVVDYMPAPTDVEAINVRDLTFTTTATLHVRMISSGSQLGRPSDLTLLQCCASSAAIAVVAAAAAAPP